MGQWIIESCLIDNAPLPSGPENSTLRFLVACVELHLNVLSTIYEELDISDTLPTKKTFLKLRTLIALHKRVIYCECIHNWAVPGLKSSECEMSLKSKFAPS